MRPSRGPSTLLSFSRLPSRLPLPPFLLRSHPTTACQIQPRAQPHRTIFNPSSIFSSTLPTQLRRLTHAQDSPHSASSIFRAIASVDHYPSFLPFTVSAAVLERDTRGWPARANLTVGYEPFNLQED